MIAQRLRAPSRISHIVKRVPELIEDAGNELPGVLRVPMDRLLERFKESERQVAELEAQIRRADIDKPTKNNYGPDPELKRLRGSSTA